MRIVVALGGNALLRRGQATTMAAQRANARSAATSLAGLTGEHRLVVTHGNGPQIGLLALADEQADTRTPLDVLGAETEGMLGYVIEQELTNALGTDVVALITRVVVDAQDPAFANPTKPVGPVVDARRARQWATRKGWAVAPEGSRWRRVVASPRPRRILEEDAIRRLSDAGVLVICGGGGGVPVVEEAGGFRGVDAVIDKDATSGLLAERLGAAALLLLTDSPAVFRTWHDGVGTDPIGSIAADDLAALRFAEGSMQPKVDAAVRFVRTTGGLAAIGALEDAAAIIDGQAGTRVTAA